MKTYSVQFRYDDRKIGPEGRTIRVEATSQASAIGKAAREFMASLTRKEKFDAGKKLSIVSLKLKEDGQ